MEHVIAKLLKDFEQGHMNRRQLIQSLALAATAAAGAAPTASAAGMEIKAVAVNHISYHVADHTKVRDFYVETLGMKVLSTDAKRSNLVFGNTSMEIGNRPANRWGIDHLGYVVDNWNKGAVETELKRRGVKPQAFSAASQSWIPEDEAKRIGVQPPAEDAQEITIKDPEGLPVQLLGRFTGQ